AEFGLETGAVLLQPGESSKIGLTFMPKEIGDREAVLWLETESGRHRFLLRGTGKFLKLAPSAYDFGRVPVGEASSGLIELVNDGNADFTISRIRSTSEEFSTYTQVSPDSKFLLPANSLRSLPINVIYEPPGRGLSTGTLRLEGFWEEGTETLEILLNGTGVAAEIELHPAGAVDFGFVVLGDSTMRSLVATNSGDTSLQVEANSLTREARLEPGAFSLEPGQSTTLRVHFSPEALGERFGQILLVSNDVRDKAQPIKIKGQGSLENIDLARITSVTVSRKDDPQALSVPWNNTPMVVRDGTKIDLRFLLPDSLRQALVGRRIDIEWTQLDENYDPKGGGQQLNVQIYEDSDGSVLAEDLNLRLKETGAKRVRLKLTTHSYPGAPPQSVSQVLEAGGWKWEFEAKPLVSFLTIRPGRDWTDSEGNTVKGETERLIGLPGIAFVGWHNGEHPAVSGVHLTAIGNVLEALSTGNSIAVSLGLAVSMYKDKFLFGFGWDIYDSRSVAKRKGSQDYIMTFKYSGLF
ncbi:MAG: choice-of-anchor D domain-containing protein, partial [Gemmatimonadetes bacterium]|nr:choice-of-anchor D domain-containing protein [Gemmatimonadota bacterium]